MENRNGIMVDLRVSQATSLAECEQELEMLEELADFTGSQWRPTELQSSRVRCGLPGAQRHPHVAQNERRPGGSTLDLRTTGWPGYEVSQRVRKRVEEIFGWIKRVGNFRHTRNRGVQRTSLAAYLVGCL